ncbi:hypothetical protein [Burkholderia multivorans]|uniref:hypothetical protein n=1 Tax=Burkholderia multivorans TaxID=87883 RepID=UPI0011B27CA4|nr:hypothetical protein [Burkholderia multivorans]
MSTNATISILNKDGTINMTYCHHDGYLIGGVGEKLLNHYKDAESVKNLIKGEAMDRLGETKQSTEFYGVGKNPEYSRSFTDIDHYKTRKQYWQKDFNYLFDEQTNSWSYNKQHDVTHYGFVDHDNDKKSFRPLNQETLNKEREQAVLDFIQVRDHHPDDIKWRKDVIEENLVKGADFENIKKMINPTRLNKQVNPSAQEKFDHAQEVANKLNAIKLDRELPEKDTYEEMMRKLGIQHKDKQEQPITRAGKIKV